MKNKAKHFVDLLVVTLMYVTLIVSPVFIVLNVLRVCSFQEGLMDLLCIIGAVIMIIISHFGTREARRNHNKGEYFLW